MLSAMLVRHVRHVPRHSHFPGSFYRFAPVPIVINESVTRPLTLL